jgi:hypothetical protein
MTSSSWFIVVPWVAGVSGLLVACASGESVETGFSEVPTGSGGGTGSSSQSGSNASSSASGSSSSGSPTSSSASSSSGSSSASSSASSSTGPSCGDLESEPNDAADQALDLGEFSDCGDGASFSGRLSTTQDVDWWVYFGNDDVGPCVEPKRPVVDATSGLRICKFFECDNGNEASVACSAGAELASSPGGLPGCCSLGPFDVQLDCGGFTDDDTANVYLRIDSASEPCTDYVVQFEF